MGIQENTGKTFENRGNKGKTVNIFETYYGVLHEKLTTNQNWQDILNE